MPAAITTVPTYAVPKNRTNVVITPANGNANFVRLWATTAPEGTAIRKRIDANKLRRDLVYQGPPGSLHPWRFNFEKGGAYTLKLQEYERGNAWGGGYEGDPRGAPSETQLGIEQDHSLYVAQRMTQQLGVSPDTADLVLYVVNETTRETLAAVHGENTPTIENPSSDKARLAAFEADVLTQLGNLKNQAILTSQLYPLFTTVNGWIDSFAAHSASAVFHQNADVQTGLTAFKVSSAGVSSPAAAAPAVNELRSRFALHIQNATKASPTPGSVTTHDQSSLNMDPTNQLLPITADPGDPTTVLLAMADFLRCYELHRLASMHESADSTNTIATSSPLLTMHRKFLEALTELSVTAPPGQSLGATELAAIGFTET